MRLRTAIPGVLFIAAGAMHFIRPEMYRTIVPPAFGHADLLVAVSGAAEVAGGLGLMLPPLQRAAGIGLIALLLAVWPANIGMALDAERFASVGPAWALWARVPLQLVMIWWIERVSRRD
ncbi:MAG: DoxX family protein [Candidatus Elarobacter sp.]